MEYFEQSYWYCRSRHSPCHCPVSADAIASQPVRNGKYEAADRKSSRLVSQEVSDLWRATTTDPVNISDNFSQKVFTVALQHSAVYVTYSLPVCADSKCSTSGEERLWSRSQNQ